MTFRWKRSGARVAFVAAAVAMPFVLLLSALRTFRSVDELRGVYLRSRVASIATRLEIATDWTLIADDEPGLVDLALLDREQSGASLAPMWEGRELYRMEATTHTSGIEIVRAFVPVHTPGGLRMARIDLANSSADFLSEHARHNVAAALLAGLVLVLLSLQMVWSTRRTIQLEQRQAQLERLAHIGEMSAVLAHEIRNPLGTIKGFAQLLHEQSGDAERSLLRPILSETTRLEDLVKDLLLYGRPPQVNLREADWRDIVSTLRAHAEALIAERPVHFAGDDANFRFRTDPGLLTQALLNLVRNGVEAIPADQAGQVTLRADVTDGLTLTVSDTGPGFSADASRHLFQPFYTTRASGTGLGLPVSRKLVESLGGTLTIEAAEPHGTAAVLHFRDIAIEEPGDRKERAWNIYS